MKKATAILIILFIFRPLFPVVDYIINYEYIATKLCENKDKPKLKCNGKCHLMKELAKAVETDTSTKKSTNQGSKKVTFDIENLYFSELKFQNFYTAYHLNLKIDDFYLCIYFHTHITSIFHPPTLSDLFC